MPGLARLVFCLVLLRAALAAAGQSRAVPPPAPEAPLPGRQARITFALAGDSIITRRAMPFDTASDPRFAGLARLVRAADVAATNLELSLFRFSEFTGWPEVENGGNWEVGPPEVASDLQAMGFDLLSRANNHTTDYGVEGMRMTDRLLDRLGLAHAGSGENLGAASRPAYFETARGRVAFLSLTTSFTPMSRAGDSRRDMVGRPGANALRLERTVEVDPHTFEALRQIAPSFSRTKAPSADVDSFELGDTREETRVKKADRVAVYERMNRRDHARVLREITNASRLADFVVVSIHSHQPGNAFTQPPEWMVELAHTCVDSGATLVAVHGPHQLRGIEIYQGRPVLYSLGNFFLQTETIDPIPADRYESAGLGDEALTSDYYAARRYESTGFPTNPVWYESVLALATFDRGTLSELRLVPIELGQTTPPSQRGTPRLAEKSKARAILERLQQLSLPFGTKLFSEGDAFVWRPARPEPTRTGR